MTVVEPISNQAITIDLEVVPPPPSSAATIVGETYETSCSERHPELDSHHPSPATAATEAHELFHQAQSLTEAIETNLSQLWSVIKRVNILFVDH